MISFLISGLQSFGQSNAQIVETYERRTIARPFFIRWIKDLIGPGFGQIEKLQLNEDGTFYYSYQDRYCGTFNSQDTGKWTQKDNQLILETDEFCSMPSTNFIVENGKLFYSLDSLANGTWALKKYTF
ncbi:hypothetical protein [Fulvivirga aurantia]|uniref:hypothetical protein n=1 Tax=Fulvivirga aurantia TaxID=2529383 RepID=UPI00162A5E00|nr:hypothetical protein [Fulvivirga aurantia]